jgi:hypothetical protein
MRRSHIASKQPDRGSTPAPHARSHAEVLEARIASTRPRRHCRKRTALGVVPPECCPYMKARLSLNAPRRVSLCWDCIEAADRSIIGRCHRDPTSGDFSRMTKYLDDHVVGEKMRHGAHHVTREEVISWKHSRRCSTKSRRAPNRIAGSSRPATRFTTSAAISP